MTKTHEIKLDGYGAHTTLAEDRPIMLLGTAESYGIETLHVVSGKSWEGLTITATFNAPDGTSTDMLMNADGNITVPSEATAKSGSGRIVFTGVSNGIQRISCDLEYFVVAHSAINGVQSGGTAPSWFEQAVTRFMPSGGTAGQVLTKKTGTDFDAEWQDSKGGAGLEPLVGTNKTLTPWQVREAFLQGQPIVFSFIDALGEVAFIFQSFEIYDDIIVASTILPRFDSQGMGVGLVIGDLLSNVWEVSETEITNPDDIQTAINTALAAAKASGGFDGITPTLGDNGNWYLGSTDTGKPSRGEQGPKGDTGETGPAGIGVPDGGTEGQLLGKTSDGPAWVDMPESGLPTGGAPYQQLVTDGTGKATWEDRTHWVEQSVSELIPEQTLSGGMSMGPPYVFNVSYFTIIPNLEYTVVFDGVEYKCISAELSGSTYIGNATLLGGPVEDTGEPFLIAPIGGMSVITATDGPHTIALSGWSIVYHQLLLDYIPNGKFLNGFIEHSSLTMTRDEASRYGEILSMSLFPMLVWKDFLIKSISTGTSHGVNIIYITDYDGALYTIAENSDGLYSVDDANNGYNYLYIKKGNISKSRLLLEGGKPVSIEGIEQTSGNAFDYTTFCVKKTGSRNGQDFEVLGNGTVKAYSVILPSSTGGSTKQFKLTVDDSGTISATEVV